MRAYLSGRGGGKTTRMLEWMRVQTDRANRLGGALPVCVCHSRTAAAQLFVRTHDERGDTWAAEDQFLCLDQLPSLEARNRGSIVLAVDNLDMLLPRLLGGRFSVGLVTATVDSAEVRGFEDDPS